MNVFLILLFIFWIIINGKFSLEIFAIGLGIIMVTGVFINKMTDYYNIFSNITFKKIILIFRYLLILLKEIIKANIDMIKIVLSPSIIEIKPTLYSVKIRLKSTLLRVALANSITLTPGTITVSMSREKFLIHAIDKKFLDGIDESIFVEKLSEMEG